MAKHDEFDNFSENFGFDDEPSDFIYEESDEEDEDSGNSGTEYMTGDEDLSDNDESADSEGEASTESQKVERKEYKKTGITIFLCGVLLFIIIVVAVGVISTIKSRKGSAPVQETQAVVQETADPNKITQVEGLGETQAQAQAQAPSEQTAQQSQATQQTQTEVKDPYDWIEVSLSDSDIQFDSTRLSGVFTITDIKTYARKTTEGTNNLQLKTVLTGSISGLIGTYTLEVPARISNSVKIGQSLEITYLLKDIDGAKVVDDIQ